MTPMAVMSMTVVTMTTVMTMSAVVTMSAMVRTPVVAVPLSRLNLRARKRK